MRLWAGQRLSKQASAKDDDGALMTLSLSLFFSHSTLIGVDDASNADDNERRLIRTADLALLPWQLKAATISLNLLDGMPKI